VSLLFSAYLFVLTPVLNSIVRANEYQADLFGLNAARQPDGFAQAALKLAPYRKLEPSPLEEMLLYDHPSGRTRIFTAMRWKAEHPETWSGTASAAPAR
jgi:STE24 endopeptidase